MEPQPSDIRPIYIISDATGRTAEKTTQAALSQFSTTKAVFIRRHHIRTEAQIKEVLAEAKAKRGLIIYTFVLESLRIQMREGALSSGLLAVDLLGPLLTTMSHFLNTPPGAEPGRLHRIDNDYFSRVEAVQFSVKHDDAQNLQGIDQADIVLVGPSRTAKTPLSIYLAQFGYKVANVPIILDLPPPKELLRVNPDRVVGLVIDPHRLQEIREARVKKLNQTISGYADLAVIGRELNYCRELYRQHPRWGVIDVTGRAVEEVANDVITRVRRTDSLK